MYSLTERATLRRASDYADVPAAPNDVLLPDAHFEAVKQLAATLPNAAQPDADGLLTYSLHRGREAIRFRNYVGLLELRGGVSLSIEPRVGHLPTLLRHLPNPPFRLIDTGHAGISPLPLWEVFIDVFLRETAAALARGLARTYVMHEAELPILRGKLRVTDQLREQRTHTLAVAYDEHTPDIPPNRLLKRALLHVQVRTQTTRNQTRCRQLLGTLADVTPSGNVLADIQAIKTTNRLLRTYDRALQWASWLLCGQGAGLCTGPHISTCLLFPMERVFEQYVAAGFRRIGAEVQTSGAHLVDDHLGQPHFKLRPDLILRRGEQTIVLDTKWKFINADDPTGHYGIEQADLYQLYAYGKKYNATDLVLIYPAHDGFRKPLHSFNYDGALNLRVVPFDVEKPLMEEVERCMMYDV
jgi:5-methylcytosine-specific restriction enzyme subunit McrC